MLILAPERYRLFRKIVVVQLDDFSAVIRDIEVWITMRVFFQNLNFVHTVDTVLYNCLIKAGRCQHGHIIRNRLALRLKTVFLYNLISSSVVI